MRQQLSLQQTLSQRLVMTQRMQQAIALLQATTLELSSLVDQELLENPCLEIDNSLDQVAPEPDPESSRSDQQTTDDREEIDLTNREFDTDWPDYFLDSSDSDPRAFASLSDRDMEWTEPVVKDTESLPEHLQKQIQMLTEDPSLISTANVIVNSLDEDGYLQTPLEDIVAMTGESPQTVEQALGLVQKCDPYGVGARNLSECLELQYHAWEMGDPPLLEVIQHHIDDLLHHRWDRIAKALQMTEAEVQEMADDIAMMEPRPGRQYGAYENEYVAPDVFIEQEDSEYVVRVNDSWIPSLRLNRQYRNMLARREELNTEERRYLKSKINAAMDLINNIEQRKQTLYRVTKEIVRQQREFLDKGIEYLKPMRLRDVADIVGVHETTVCRVVNGKYAQTPQGLLELKYFFSTGLRATDGGDDASAKAVKARIQQLVDDEPQSKPLSDSKISAILAKEGIQVARRTVAKYRDQLGILPTSQRRRDHKK